MNENNDIMLDESEQTIDLGQYAEKLKKHWKVILWWTLGAFVLGCLIALGTPRTYVCVSKLAPELSNTATNRLSSMASMIGFSSSVLGTTDAVYPMVYPDLVHSPDFVADLFLLPVDFVSKTDSVHTTLYDYMENYAPKSVVGVVLSTPAMLFDWVKGLFRKEEELQDSLAVINPFNFTKKQGRIYNKLSKCIEAQIDKKTLVVTVRTSFDNRFICAELSKAVNENIKLYVTRYRTQKAEHDRQYYEELCNEARKEYYAAQARYSSYVDTHNGLVLQSNIAERERLHNESSLKFQLYNSTAQQLQSAEAKVQMETPVFAEIVTPTVPFKSSNSRKKSALLFAIFGLCIGTIVVLVKYKGEEV